MTISMRRLRMNPVLREALREHRIHRESLILPLFVVEEESMAGSIFSFPGMERFSLQALPEALEEIVSLGLRMVLLFGIPRKKDPQGERAYREDGVVQQALRIGKSVAPSLLYITDVCLCGYTTHGHCGIVVDGRVDNEATLPVLAEIALSHVRAGADMVAPSSMMDGQVRAIRRRLDEAGFAHIPIMAYSAKYASAFYGPFREVACSRPQFGDRRSYQMDFGNRWEALREVALDIEEGADIVMVKPALLYLDVIREIREHFQVPVAAYSVSGEYAMVKTAAQEGFLEEKPAVLELLTAIKRAGADLLITYYAREIAQWEDIR
ncbi:MAG: porphobilinogen synthase [Atribacterota bacterium]